MEIKEYIQQQFITLNLLSEQKEGAIREIAQLLKGAPGVIDFELFVEDIFERERLGTTGIGDGIAIPHGKLPGMDELMVSFGRSTAGVDFEAMDEKPAHLFFLLVAPENSVGEHLKALARISRLMRDASFRKKLMESKNLDQLYSVIAEEDEKH